MGGTAKVTSGNLTVTMATVAPSQASCVFIFDWSNQTKIDRLLSRMNRKCRRVTETAHNAAM